MDKYKINKILQKRGNNMGTVTMDLEELRRIEAQVDIEKEKANKEKQELNNLINKLTNEKETLLSNQKRVMYTKKIIQTKQYLPCTWDNMQRLIVKSLQETIKWNRHFVDDMFIREVSYALLKDLQRDCVTSIEPNAPMPPEKEDNYEFINLDDAVKMALDQEDCKYTQELKKLKKQNANLQERINDFENEKEIEIENIIKEKEEKINNLKESHIKKYNILKEESDKALKDLETSSTQKYKELEESSNKKYKELEEAFAKFRGDEENMAMKDLLEKYKKENTELKTKIEELDALSKKKWWKFW